MDQFEKEGTCYAPMYEYEVPAQGSVSVSACVCQSAVTIPSLGFAETFAERIQEADEFYQGVTTTDNPELQQIQRQAFAGLLWSKQYFNIDIPRWLNGDPGQPPPPPQRKSGETANGRASTTRM